MTLTERLESDDVELVLIKGGGHRLSEPAELARLCAVLEDLSARVAERLRTE